MKAYIFTSPADRWAAHLCRFNAESLGMEATVVVDRDVETVPGEIVSQLPRIHAHRNARLYGEQAAVAMMDTYIRHAHPDEIVVRLEADTLLLPRRVDWLVQARDTGKAHGYRLNGRKWCGVWAVNASALPATRAVLETVKPCHKCGGCLISSAFKATCGIRRALPDASQVWRPGDTVPPERHFLTLGPCLPRPVRDAHLTALYALVGLSAELGDFGQAVLVPQVTVDAHRERPAVRMPEPP